MSETHVTPKKEETNDSPNTQNATLDEHKFNERVITAETRKLARYTAALFYATCVLGLGTIGAVAVGIWQGTITRDALSDQRRYDSVQIRNDSIRRVGDSVATIKQDTFQRATLDSTGTQIAIAKETMQKQLRAYMSIDPYILGTIIQGKIPRISLHLVNLGLTPAYKSSIWCVCRLDSAPRYQFHDTTTPKIAYFGYVPPRKGENQIRYEPTFDRNHIASTDTAAFKKGQLAIYYFGEMRYRDAFDVPHLTEFRFAIEWDEETNNLGAPHPTEEGNEAN
jgi:hypothetical protein